MSADRRKFMQTRDSECGRRWQEERENDGLAGVFDEMVAVAVQAVLSSV